MSQRDWIEAPKDLVVDYLSRDFMRFSDWRKWSPTALASYVATMLVQGEKDGFDYDVTQARDK